MTRKQFIKSIVAVPLALFLGVKKAAGYIFTPVLVAKESVWLYKRNLITSEYDIKVNHGWSTVRIRRPVKFKGETMTIQEFLWRKFWSGDQWSKTQIAMAKKKKFQPLVLRKRKIVQEILG